MNSRKRMPAASASAAIGPDVATTPTRSPNLSGLGMRTEVSDMIFSVVGTIFYNSRLLIDKSNGSNLAEIHRYWKASGAECESLVPAAFGRSSLRATWNVMIHTIALSSKQTPTSRGLPSGLFSPRRKPLVCRRHPEKAP